MGTNVRRERRWSPSDGCTSDRCQFSVRLNFPIFTQFKNGAMITPRKIFKKRHIPPLRYWGKKGKLGKKGENLGKREEKLGNFWEKWGKKEEKLGKK